jgi:hypothetical protein
LVSSNGLSEPNTLQRGAIKKRKEADLLPSGIDKRKDGKNIRLSAFFLFGPWVNKRCSQIRLTTHLVQEAKESQRGEALDLRSSFYKDQDNIRTHQGNQGCDQSLGPFPNPFFKLYHFISGDDQ